MRHRDQREARPIDRRYQLFPCVTRARAPRWRILLSLGSTRRSYRSSRGPWLTAPRLSGSLLRAHPVNTAFGLVLLSFFILFYPRHPATLRVPTKRPFTVRSLVWFRHHGRKTSYRVHRRHVDEESVPGYGVH
jgi:hypothetical protein